MGPASIVLLGDGSGVPRIMDVASIHASVPNGPGTGGEDASQGLGCPLWRDALLGALRWEKKRRGRARGMTRGSHGAHLSVT